MENQITILVEMEYLDGTTKTRETKLNSSYSGFNDLFINRNVEHLIDRDVKEYKITTVLNDTSTIFIKLKEIR